MRYDDHCGILVALCEVEDYIQHLVDHLRVKRCGYLVKQHDVRIHYQAAHDCNALLLTAGKLRGVRVRLIRKSDPCKKFHCLGGDFLLCAFLDFQRSKRDVVHYRHVREQVVALENHSDLLAHIVKAGFSVLDRLAVKLYRTALDRLQTVDTAQQSAFSAARGTHQHHYFAFFNAERKVVDYRIIAKSFGKMIYIYNMISHFVHPSF